MGQQQLLLIILGVIIVGIAVVIGITMFKDNAISANRDSVTNDLVNLGARAHQFYRRPVALGGGGSSFAGLTMDKLARPATGNQWVNEDGTFEILGTPSSTEVTLKGVGVQKNDGTVVEVHCRATSDSLMTTVIH
ncbi:MAG: hypothetical protein AABZ61_03065 [Bacteroidota bacterium]